MRIIVDFEHNNEHNDTVFEEIRNRIMMKIWSIIPSSLAGSYNAKISCFSEKVMELYMHA